MAIPKINRENSRPEIAFDYVKVGESFTYKQSLYLKIAPLSARYNAFNLDTQQRHTFEEGTKVCIEEVEINVK